MAVDISGLISAAQSNANNTLSAAQSAMSFAINAVANVGGGVLLLPGATSGVIVDPALPAAFVPATPPQLTPINLKEYEEPGAAPEPQPVPDPLDGIGDVPENTATPLDYNEPQLPSALGSFGHSSPSVTTSFSFPAVPSALSNNVEAPIITNRSAPAAPQILLPVFDAQTPENLPAAPSDYAEQFTNQYREHAPLMYAALQGQMDAFLSRMNPSYHSQLSTLQSKLNTYLGGGTGLTPAVEDAIYERGKDKVKAEARRVINATFKDAAKRGFTMPSGATFAAMQQARQGAADNLARVSTEILIKQAELEQQNMQFAVTQTAGLTQMTLSAMIGYHQNLVGINGQALEAARNVLSALIENYNAIIKGFELELASYKAEADVYDTKLRAAMAGIELYKAEIQALEALTNVDRAKVEIYRGRIDALNALASVYKTQVEAVVSRAGLEKLKIDLYGAQVQAYHATVQAKTAEFQGYAAAVNGEEAKIRVYSEQIRGYVAEVDAWKAKIEAKSEQIRSVTLNNQSIADAYKSTVDVYTAKVDANAKMVASKIDYGRELIQEYSIANTAAVGAAQVRSDLYRTQTQVAIERGKMEQARKLATEQIELDKAKAVSTAVMAAGRIYGSLASSTMSGMNTLVANTVAE